MSIPSILGQLLFTVPPAEVSAAERDLLRRLVAESERDDGEQLTRFAPGGWWLGSEQVSAKVCFRLIRHCLIQREDCGNGIEDKEVLYWSPCSDAARLLSNDAAMREYVDKMRSRR
jgi:hypothetical protein